MKNYNDHIKYYHENDNIGSEAYCLNGILHRTDGPAFIYYDKNNNISVKRYYINGNIHRTDGPAAISYYENGNIKKEYYWLNDDKINVNSLEEFKQYQKTLILK